MLRLTSLHLAATLYRTTAMMVPTNKQNAEDVLKKRVVSIKKRGKRNRVINQAEKVGQNPSYQFFS